MADHQHTTARQDDDVPAGEKTLVASGTTSMAISTRPGVPPTADADAASGSPKRTPLERGPAAPSNAVEVHGAGKRLGETWVLKNLDFTVEAGTIFGLLGASGSGKTTTIRLLLGLLAPDEGEVSVLGRPPRTFEARTRARIGYMPQLFVLYPELSVQDNVELVASLYGLGWLKRRKAIHDKLDFVELWAHRKKTTNDLSGGMKRRLELATALLHDPELIVVDEPTAGVDPILRAKFWDHFRRLRDDGRTIIVTSQYVTEADYCDRVAILGRGQLVANGTPESIRRQAMGGDTVDVVAEGIDRRLVAALQALDGVRRVEQLTYEQLRMTVAQGSVTIPRVLSTLGESGAEIKQVQEYRPSFDDVFVRLMEQSDVESVE